MGAQLNDFNKKDVITIEISVYQANYIWVDLKTQPGFKYEIINGSFHLKNNVWFGFEI